LDGTAGPVVGVTTGVAAGAGVAGGAAVGASATSDGDGRPGVLAVSVASSAGVVSACFTGTGEGC